MEKIKAVEGKMDGSVDGWSTNGKMCSFCLHLVRNLLVYAEKRNLVPNVNYQGVAIISWSFISKLSVAGRGLLFYFFQLRDQGQNGLWRVPHAQNFTSPWLVWLFNGSKISSTQSLVIYVEYTETVRGNFRALNHRLLFFSLPLMSSVKG